MDQRRVVECSRWSGAGTGGRELPSLGVTGKTPINEKVVVIFTVVCHICGYRKSGDVEVWFNLMAWLTGHCPASSQAIRHLGVKRLGLRGLLRAQERMSVETFGSGWVVVGIDIVTEVSHLDWVKSIGGRREAFTSVGWTASEERETSS